MRRILGMLCVLVLAAPVAADSRWVDIPPDLRIRNRQGNCVWAAVEMAFVEAGFTELRGIFDDAISKGWHGSYHADVVKVLERHGVPFRQVKTSKMDFDWLEDARRLGVAVYVQISGYDPSMGGYYAHALNVVGGAYRVEVWYQDNNPWIRERLETTDPKRVTWDKFVSQWDGNAIYPAERRSPQRPLPEGKGEKSKPLNVEPALLTDAEILKTLGPEINVNLGPMKETFEKLSKVLEKIEKADFGGMFNYGQMIIAAVMGAFGINVYHTRQLQLKAPGPAPPKV